MQSVDRGKNHTVETQCQHPLIYLMQMGKFGYYDNIYHVLTTTNHMKINNRELRSKQLHELQISATVIEILK